MKNYKDLIIDYNLLDSESKKLFDTEYNNIQRKKLSNKIEEAIIKPDGSSYFDIKWLKQHIIKN